MYGRSSLCLDHKIDLKTKEKDTGSTKRLMEFEVNQHMTYSRTLSSYPSFIITLLHGSLIYSWVGDWHLQARLTFWVTGLLSFSGILCTGDWAAFDSWHLAHVSVSRIIIPYNFAMQPRGPMSIDKKKTKKKGRSRPLWSTFSGEQQFKNVMEFYTGNISTSSWCGIDFWID